MKLTFQGVLIGADDEEAWLCDLKHSKIKIERKLYSNLQFKFLEVLLFYCQIIKRKEMSYLVK